MKTKQKEYPVIHVKFLHPSFSWSSGLYILLNVIDDEYEMCKLNEDGTPELFDDGRFMISCTGKNNNEFKEITKTNLIYKTK